MSKLVKYRFIISIGLLFWQTHASAQLTYETLRVVYDTPWIYKNLKLIPVRFKQKDPALPAILLNDPNLISLSDAMQKRMIKVKEIKYNGGSDLNLLEVVNTSKSPILVNSGELLSGGKQDRMVGETKLIPPGKEKHYLKVFCIEKGRWDNKPRVFKHRGRASAELRKTMDISNRQAKIWKNIDSSSASSNKKLETGAFLKLFNDSLRTDTGYINFFTRKYRQTDSLFAGFVAVTGNQIISCELYTSTKLSNSSFREMLNTFVFSAVTKGSRPLMTNDRVRDFLDKFLISEAIQKAYIPGHGKLHKYNNRLIHLTAYND
ncbi:MAG TPA: DUF6569 family protein [Segetibacter sp.]|jgi:hypothetical protein